MSSKFEGTQAGNLSDSTPPNSATSDKWKTLSIESVAIEGFKWHVICEERWTDPVNQSYECYRITRRCDALGGQVYATATHITPMRHGRGSGDPTVSESLIWCPVNEARSKGGD